jgi:hypothetical protein
MNTEISHLAARMKRLSRPHRLAHLRALVRREPAGSTRRYRLVALLLDQLAALPANENRSL